jgi:LemA protein
MAQLTLIAVVVVGLVVVLLAWAIAGYNAFVRLRNRFQNAFAQIDVQLKRRFELIPNLVEAAKAYLTHERETLTAVISARAAAVSASERLAARPGGAEEMKALAAEDATLTGALKRLLAVVESYPNLKADKTIASVTEELTATENKVSFARQAYNDAVLTYNTKVQQFPDNVLASVFRFDAAPPFATESAAERQAVRVSFG